MTVTPDAVRQLLASAESDPTLVVHEGTPRVVSGAELQGGAYSGSLVVAGRDDLRDMAGDLDLDHPTDQDLEALARRLDTAVTELGG